MKRWEYLALDIVGTLPATVEKGAWLNHVVPHMNSMGEDGWELVQFLGSFAYFKREIDDSDPAADAKASLSLEEYLRFMP